MMNSVRTCARKQSPADMEELAKQYHDHMLESISDEDDQIMTLYLEGEDIPEKMIRAALRPRDDRQ